MKFLVDAQLPRRLANWLSENEHDSVHTLELPKGNRTPDKDINRISVEEKRIVITKDADFVNSFIIQGEPYKLLLVSTGNITNRELIEIFANNIEQIEEAFHQNNFIEVTDKTVSIHS
jgi:predicted nuclease of predicted toxin-antitoxin system